MRRLHSILVVAVLFASGASAGVLWDNGIVPNGVNGRAISPPAFPDIRVADDVVFNSIVLIQNFHANVIEDDGWVRPDTAVFEVREDAGGSPGDIVATHEGDFTAMDTGDIYFGRSDYDYWIQNMDIALDAGIYWITIRMPEGGGSGTNYWMTSDGGRDGPSSSTGYFSTDAGETWMSEGDGWHHAFVLPVPEPSTCLLLGLGGLALLRRRR